MRFSLLDRPEFRAFQQLKPHKKYSKETLATQASSRPSQVELLGVDRGVPKVLFPVPLIRAVPVPLSVAPSCCLFYDKLVREIAFTIFRFPSFSKSHSPPSFGFPLLYTLSPYSPIYSSCLPSPPKSFTLDGTARSSIKMSFRKPTEGEILQYPFLTAQRCSLCYWYSRTIFQAVAIALQFRLEISALFFPVFLTLGFRCYPFGSQSISLHPTFYDAVRR